MLTGACGVERLSCKHTGASHSPAFEQPMAANPHFASSSLSLLSRVAQSLHFNSVQFDLTNIYSEPVLVVIAAKVGRVWETDEQDPIPALRESQPRAAHETATQVTLYHSKCKEC